VSPKVNLDLEDVPFAILEVVKARILANRARIGQTRPRPSTRPRPQFRKTGASSKGWRKPQYGAGVLGGGNLIIVELKWLDGADYDLNAGINSQYVGWTFSSRDDVNDGSLWNQLFWLGDNTDEGPASEYIVFDKTRQPQDSIEFPGQILGYPGDDFILELYSYCYEELSTQPLQVFAYVFDVTPELGFDPEKGIEDIDRLKQLFTDSPQYPLQAFSVTVNRFNPDGELGVLIGRVDLSSTDMTQAST